MAESLIEDAKLVRALPLVGKMFNNFTILGVWSFASCGMTSVRECACERRGVSYIAPGSENG